MLRAVFFSLLHIMWIQAAFLILSGVKNFLLIISFSLFSDELLFRKLQKTPKEDTPSRASLQIVTQVHLSAQSTTSKDSHGK